jgi:hypothetical protein
MKAPVSDKNFGMGNKTLVPHTLWMTIFQITKFSHTYKHFSKHFATQNIAMDDKTLALYIWYKWQILEQQIS